MVSPFLMSDKFMVMDNYVAVGYKNEPSKDTPLNAENLNKTDSQVKSLTDNLRNVQLSLESGQVAQALEAIQDEAVALNEQVQINKTAITGLGTAQAGQASAISALQTSKVNLDGLHKTYNELTPTQYSNYFS